MIVFLPGDVFGASVCFRFGSVNSKPQSIEHPPEAPPARADLFPPGVIAVIYLFAPF
jgi:hypothetical protein